MAGHGGKKEKIFVKNQQNLSVWFSCAGKYCFHGHRRLLRFDLHRRDSMQGKVEICGVNTARLNVLSQVEMDALLHRAAQGDRDARQKLIEGNLRLVLSVIQRFDKRGENPDDLFQVGCIGLMKAINNFDPTKQVRFSTYGVPMV
jgi:DNA-directed RNA polymerase sigma subunit (sigma70/sigma32)